MTNTNSKSIYHLFGMKNADKLAKDDAAALRQHNARKEKIKDDAVATGYVLYSGERFYNGELAVKDIAAAEIFSTYAAAEKNKSDYDGTCYCQIVKVYKSPSGKWMQI